MRTTTKYVLSLLSIAVTSLLLHAHAGAQTANSNSGASSNSGAAAGARSSSRAVGVINNYGPADPSSSGGGDPTITYQGDYTIRSAPTVYVPNIVTGNVCALGASAGASFIGTGFAVGGSWESQQCERRQQAALLYNAGMKQASYELMCDQHEVYDAMKRAGTPCLPRPAWDPPVTTASTGNGGSHPVAAAPAPVKTAVLSKEQMFRPSDYPSGAECLNAAASYGVPLTMCKGKP